MHTRDFAKICDLLLGQGEGDPKTMTNVRITLGIALFLSFWIAIGVFSAYQQMPVFSQQTLLESTWYHYKQEYLEPGTYRALDKQRQNITTSEGQSYTLLRAVWMDDKETFDASWQWTKDNLQRSDDKLLSWLFGERPDGTYGVLDAQGGANTATDADVDTALALLFASQRWHDQADFGDALDMIHDIWDHEVMTINGRPYILANNVEKVSFTNTAVINPSYFAPYAYRIFSQVDPDHDWLGLVDTSYDVLAEVSDQPLDTQKSDGLPPDWVLIDKHTGELSAPDGRLGLTTNYSYDALRTPWRLAVDAAWFQEPRATAALQRFQLLSDEWQAHHALASSYRHDGQVAGQDDSYAVYGGAIGYFATLDPRLAEHVYMKKLEALYNSSTFNWHQDLSYYDANWVWFGIALYNGKVSNLYSSSLTAYEKSDVTFNFLSSLQRSREHPG